MAYSVFDGVPIYGKNLIRMTGLKRINPDRDFRVTLGPWEIHCPVCNGLGFQIMKRYCELARKPCLVEEPCQACRLKGKLDSRCVIGIDEVIMAMPTDIEL